MRPTASREVQAHRMRWNVVQVRIRLEVRQVATDRRRIVIGKPVEQLCRAEQVVVQSAGDLLLTEWRLISAVQHIEWRRESDRREQVLKHMLAGGKEEQLVLDDRTTHRSAHVIALIIVV